MNIRCKNDWLFHDWGTDGKCIRGCGAIASVLRARTQPDVTSGDDPSLSASPVKARLVDPLSRHGSRLLPR